MNLTNFGNMPEPIVRAVMNDTYSNNGSDYSVTDLLNPVQLTILRKRYDSQITEDVVDGLWRLMGKAAHAVAEMSGAKLADALTEERIHIEVFGKNVSGQADLYHLKKISDFKITSVFTAIYGSRKKEWEQQLNCYRYLFEQLGFPVDELEIVAIYRDWSKTERARYGDRYPKQGECHPIEVWPIEAAQAFIEGCVTNLIAAESIPDDNLPPCTEEDMWAKPDTWALKKKGAVRATKVCNTQEEADAALAGMSKPGDYEVVKRPGERTRCEHYCAVKDFCSQFMRYKTETEAGNE